MSIYDDIVIDNDAHMVPARRPRHVRPEGLPAPSWPVLPDDDPRAGLVFAPAPMPGVLTDAMAQGVRELFSNRLREALAAKYGVLAASELVRPRYWRRRLLRWTRRIAAAVTRTTFVVSLVVVVAPVLGAVAYGLGV